MRLLFLAFFAIGLASCKTDLTGQLDLGQSLSVNHEVSGHYGDSESTRIETTKIKPGVHQARISLSGCCDLTLTLNPKSWKRQTFKMSLPRNTSLPKDEGDFHLSGKDINQNFDLKGSLFTQVQDSEVIKRYERCQYQDYQTICDSRGCYSQPIWRTGTQWVEFFDRYKTVTMNATFQVANHATEIGSFKGVEETHEKIILYQTSCR